MGEIRKIKKDKLVKFCKNTGAKNSPPSTRPPPTNTPTPSNDTTATVLATENPLSHQKLLLSPVYQFRQKDGRFRVLDYL